MNPTAQVGRCDNSCGSLTKEASPWPLAVQLCSFPPFVSCPNQYDSKLCGFVYSLAGSVCFYRSPAVASVEQKGILMMVVVDIVYVVAAPPPSLLSVPFAAHRPLEIALVRRRPSISCEVNDQNIRKFIERKTDRTKTAWRQGLLYSTLAWDKGSLITSLMRPYFPMLRCMARRIRKVLIDAAVPIRQSYLHRSQVLSWARPQ